MSIWDVVGNVLEKKQSADNEDKPDKDKKPPLIATTFTANFGDTITTLMGGGRFTNLIGSDAKVVFDWEEAVKDGFSKIPGVGKKVGEVLEGKGLGGKVFSAFMGLGGDAGLVYGNKTAFHYSGKAFTSRRGGTPSAEFKDTTTKNTYAVGKRRAVYIALLTGIAAIIALSVTVRVRYNNFPMNKEKTELETEDDEVVKNLICDSFVICEDRWLLLLRHMDIGFQMAFLFKDTIKTAESGLKTATDKLKAKEAEFRAANSLTSTQELRALIKVLTSQVTDLLAIQTDAQKTYDERFINKTIDLKCYLE